MKSALFTKFKVTSADKKPTSSKRGNSANKPDTINKPTGTSDGKKRKKSGCFCCRKRRIKCIGVKPTCSNCQKSGYVCVWPSGLQSLSHDTDFKPIKISSLAKPLETEEVEKVNNIVSDNKLTSEKAIGLSNQTFLEPPLSMSGNLVHLPQKISPMLMQNSLSEKTTLSTDTKKIVEIANELENLNEQEAEEVEEKIELVQGKTYLVKNNKQNQSEIEIRDFLFREVLIEINSTFANGFISMSQNSNRHNENGLLYNAFVNGFMIEVSPQLAHFKLQPGSAFIPTGLENPMLQNLFFSCGAAFVYATTKNDTMLQLCHDKLNNSVVEVKSFLQSQNLEGNETWLIIYLLLLHLKLRFVYESQVIHTLSIIAAIEAIKVWCARRRKFNNAPEVVELDSQNFGVLDDESLGIANNMESSSSTANTFRVMNDDEASYIDINNPADFFPPEQYQNYNSTEIMFVHIINKCRLFLAKTPFKTSLSTEVTSKLDSTSFETQIFTLLNNELVHEFDVNNKSTNNNEISIFPYERTMLESFVFNYTSMLFACDRSLINQITSPFIVFEALKDYLSKPLYKCAVPWMNHPVAGAALPVYELQAKACWIAFFTPLSPKHRKLLEQIRKVANYYTRPILPLDVYCTEPETVQKKLLESCYAAEIISKAVFIYSSKLLNPEIQTDDVLVQHTLQLACDAFKNLSPHSNVHTVLVFAMAVLGSCALKKEHQEFFLQKMTKLRELFGIVAFRKLPDFYRKAWSSPDLGLNAVYSVEILNSFLM
ncbi:hypothetical protein DAPK24_042300 [Pichia kluyveri]|uniref:Zn(2)-C6 fungal-type domain-containing protein n=1 Tax=Pichia kluyveri TaxID=36015 RepID=A0AAV5R9G9_PICKL|nr:hypothetical protein DAPK24_042300 [Pichia kluyveri]